MKLRRKDEFASLCEVWVNGLPVDNVIYASEKKGYVIHIPPYLSCQEDEIPLLKKAVGVVEVWGPLGMDRNNE